MLAICNESVTVAPLCVSKCIFDAKIFHDWFTKFVETVETRPLSLLFDGQLTHLTLATIDLAIQENFSLVKLPAHCTDALQPLGISCFSPLKQQYEKLLTEFVHRTGRRQKL